MADTIDYVPGVTLSMRVSDYARSLAWYRDVLGFEVEYELPDMGWCELKSRVPGVNVGLSQVEEVKPEQACVPVFGVKDIDQARRILESRKVRFDGDTRTIPEMVKLATFFDPDGNALMLYESLGMPPGTS